jgi:hypothetical protein
MNESDESGSPLDDKRLSKLEYEDSISSKSYHTVKSGIKQVGKGHINELLSELRHKYFTILKSHYWESLEEG